ncbi:hypothetical protein [Aliarcobacter skirrowii]|uniref:hypothetical protein n=1 Tax=Aliarcobacter skirrowii TaxID=28200 RepID=UPI0008308A69|nr:hypothetical protein [Aliarcobacter skirrowii]
MNKLSQEVQNFIDENNLEYISTLHENQRKKTYIFLVADKDKKQYVLKAIEDQSPQEIKEKFYNEVKFYKQYSFNFIPKYIRSNDFVLQIEFIEAITFREYLLTGKVTNKQINLLFKNAFDLYENIENKQLNNSNFKKAYSHLGALATSGPMQTKNMKISLFDRIFSKIILKILRYKLKKIIINMETKNLRFGFSHGDMHYNNILITKLNKIKLIDFENINYDGFYDFDLIYLYVMVELYINDESFAEVKKSIVEKICMPEDNLFKVIKLYKKAILINQRFQVGLKMENSKILILFRSLIE